MIKITSVSPDRQPTIHLVAEERVEKTLKELEKKGHLQINVESQHECK